MTEGESSGGRKSEQGDAPNARVLREHMESAFAPQRSMKRLPGFSIKTFRLSRSGGAPEGGAPTEV
jgi:hypothetical protein